MENIIGKKYTKLLVLKETDKRTKQRTRIFLCQCDCGNFKEVAREKLRHGTKSCGCLKNNNLSHKEAWESKHWAGYGEISKSLFSRIKNCAKQRNHKFSITIEYLWELFLKQDRKCALTGTAIELPITLRKLRNKSDQRIASLDRIDNSKGYVVGNVRWICKRLNYMKHTMSDKDFLQWIKEVYLFNFQKKSLHCML
jgi:hypothetical protein